LRQVGQGVDPNTGQMVFVARDREGNLVPQTVPGGLQPAKQFDANARSAQTVDMANAGVASVLNAIGTGYIKQMAGPTKSALYLDKARQIGLYGKYDEGMETQIDQTVERLRSYQLLDTTGKAVNETELRGVKAWSPDKTMDSPENFGKKVIKMGLWTMLVEEKKRRFAGGMTNYQRSIGFVNKINSYGNQIYKEIERMGPGASEQSREALLNVYADKIMNEVLDGSGGAIAPPNTPAAPTARAKEAPTPILPTPGNVKKLRYNPATGKPE
jgi:hypothetical protein